LQDEYQFNWPVSSEREIELLREVLESGRWGGHSDLSSGSSASSPPLRIARTAYRR
jgi:hypothetical protein